ncbi:MAG: hypothetical protein JWN22_1322 [Nocardioides sp.]|nr:hypothetical protein [Nocardioides sp.]
MGRAVAFLDVLAVAGLRALGGLKAGDASYARLVAATGPSLGTPGRRVSLSDSSDDAGTLMRMDHSEKDRLDKAFADIGLYDREGRRIPYSEFRRLRQDHSYRFLARDKVGDVEVVTAWLGMDQGDHDRPWIFGTATLAADGTLVDDRELFASTEDEAVANHAEVLAGRTVEHEANTGD